MVGTFLALAVGQLLIGRAELETAAPFNAIVTLFAMARRCQSKLSGCPGCVSLGA